MHTVISKKMTFFTVFYLMKLVNQPYLRNANTLYINSNAVQLSRKTFTELKPLYILVP